MPSRKELDAARKRNKYASNPEWAAKEVARKRAWRARQVPKGMRLGAVSKLVDAAGEMRNEWQKSALRPDDPPKLPLAPPGFTKVRQSNMLDRKGGAVIQWESFERDKADQWHAMWQACKDACAEYEGRAKLVPCPVSTIDRQLTVYPIGDPHIGMLAWARETDADFDSNIAKRDLTEVVTMLVDCSPASETALIAQLGDFFHAQDNKQTTPRGGNKLDVDSRSGRVTEVGYMLMVTVIDLALKKHKRVLVINLRGNHDPDLSLSLNMFLKAWYRNEPRVEILDNNNPFIYYEFGKNLLGFHHGHGARPEQLGGIMSCYQDGVPWGRTHHRKWFTGHIHSSNGRDLPGCDWESFRTLAPEDYWAHEMGFRSNQSLDSLTFDIEDGLLTRQTVSLRLARKRMEVRYGT